jgi:hypothetical protein
MRCSRCTAGLHDLGQISVSASLYKFLAQGCCKVVLRASFVDSFLMCTICTAWLGSYRIIQVSYPTTTKMAQSSYVQALISKLL